MRVGASGGSRGGEERALGCRASQVPPNFCGRRALESEQSFAGRASRPVESERPRGTKGFLILDSGVAGRAGRGAGGGGAAAAEWVRAREDERSSRGRGGEEQEQEHERERERESESESMHTRKAFVRPKLR